ACLIQKTEPLGTVDEASRHSNEVMLRICREFGSKVSAMGLRDFELGLSFNGSALIELNEHLLCSDTALVHAAMGRGATLLDRPLGTSGAIYARTTLTHGFELVNRPKFTSHVNEPLQVRVDEAMISTANKNFPWRFWSDREGDR